MRFRLSTQYGFSLIELTVVLFIMGLLLHVSIEPLGARLDNQRRLQSVEQLRQIRQQLRSHWVSYGYLPCPIASVSLGSNNVTGCQHAVGGVPANTLSMVGAANERGELLDPWGQALRYHVSLADVNQANSPNTPDWVTAGEIAEVTFTELEADLSVCREALAGACAQANQAAADIVAVIVSAGSENFARERDNRDSDNRYISAPYSTAESYRFDDQLIWLGRSELIYFALESGWLP